MGKRGGDPNDDESSRERPPSSQPPRSLGQRFDHALQKYPVRTKFATGVLLGSLSNVCSQLIEGRRFSLAQALSFALVTGPPFGHWWFPFVSRVVPDNSQFLGIPVFVRRMLVDQLTFGPCITFCQCTLLALRCSTIF